MRKTKKRMSVLLAVLVAVPALLIPASADPGSDRTIMMGTSAIRDPVESHEDGRDESDKYQEPSDYIWFGKNNGDPNDPIMWRVLDADQTNAGGSGMFLLSQWLLTDEGVAFDSDGSNNVWQGSDAQAWCKDFAGESGAAGDVPDAFTETELDAVLPVTKTDSAQTLYDISWEESSLAGDKVFFLSAEELSQYVGNYNGAPGMRWSQNIKDGTYASWWLRSPQDNTCAGAILSGYEDAEELEGTVLPSNDYYIWSTVGDFYKARPALNLKPDSILFTSLPYGGKSGDPGLHINTESPAAYEWKLTLLDGTGHVDFDVETEPVTASVGDSIALNYTGATTGENERISAMIVNDANEILYYGNLKDMANGETAGSLDIGLPGDLPEGIYTLKIFNEQCNGDRVTDYSSAMKDVTLSVTAPPPAPPAPPAPPTPPAPPAPGPAVVVTPGDEETPEAAADPQEPAAAAGRPAPTRTQDAPSAEPFTVRFDAGGGSGEMESAGAAAGKEYVLPECRFAAPEGKVFDRWDVRAPEDAGGRFFAPGERITVTGSVIIRAVWKDAPEPAPASDDSGPAGEPVSGIGVPLVIAAAALAGIVILFLFRRKKK